MGLSAAQRDRLAELSREAGEIVGAHYRRQGLPLTSSLMESTVKQVSRRVKGTEKYWSSAGGEAILRLRGEYLSEDSPMRSYWTNRSLHATGTRAYRCTTVSTINS